jgi:hypothetical protein
MAHENPVIVPAGFRVSLADVASVSPGIPGEVNPQPRVQDPQRHVQPRVHASKPGRTMCPPTITVVSGDTLEHLAGRC